MTQNLEEIVHEGRRLALIIRADFSTDGIRFLTPPEASLQLGYMKRPMGYKVQPHVHNKVQRTTETTQEVLFVRNGCVRVDFYTESGTPLTSRRLDSGDWIVLFEGGHGFEFMEPSELLEVKNGPYAADADKRRFSTAEDPR